MWTLARLSLVTLGIAIIVSAPSRADEPTATDKPTDQTEPTKHSAAKKPAPRKPPKKTAAQLKKEAARAKWLELLKEREVDPWPENETDEEHAAALKKSREMA